MRTHFTSNPNLSKTSLTLVNVPSRDPGMPVVLVAVEIPLGVLMRFAIKVGAALTVACLVAGLGLVPFAILVKYIF